MNKKEFSQIRHHLGRTQKQIAQLLGTSPKAIQSFEQGWRSVPVHIERQVLFLVALKSSHKKYGQTLLGHQRYCSEKIRQRCPAWEFQAGHLCWFINGTICQGQGAKKLAGENEAMPPMQNICEPVLLQREKAAYLTGERLKHAAP